MNVLGPWGPIHVDECPDCGTPTTMHGLDAPGHCPHGFERRVPVEYVRADAYRGAVQENERLRSVLAHVINRVSGLGGEARGIFDTGKAALDHDPSGGQSGPSRAQEPTPDGMTTYRALAEEMRRAAGLHDSDMDRRITSWDARAWAAKVEALQATAQGAVSLEALTDWLLTDDAQDATGFGPGIRRGVAEAIRARFGGQ